MVRAQKSFIGKSLIRVAAPCQNKSIGTRRYRAVALSITSEVIDRRCERR
jgi:hypothetical protein